MRCVSCLSIIEGLERRVQFKQLLVDRQADDVDEANLHLGQLILFLAVHHCLGGGERVGGVGVLIRSG